jgi:hypothetical protein
MWENVFGYVVIMFRLNLIHRVGIPACKLSYLCFLLFDFALRSVAIQHRRSQGPVFSQTRLRVEVG